MNTNAHQNIKPDKTDAKSTRARVFFHILHRKGLNLYKMHIN